MRGIILLILVTLVLSLHLAPSHKEQTSSVSDSDHSNPLWEGYMETCQHHYLKRAMTEMNAEGFCEGLQPNECKNAKERGESAALIQSENYCGKVISVGKAWMEACAEEKCEGEEDQECAEHLCKDEFLAHMKAKVIELGSEMAAAPPVNLSSHPLPPMDKKQTAYWWRKEHYQCHKTIIPFFKDTVTAAKCQDEDEHCRKLKQSMYEQIDDHSLAICKDLTREATLFYEECVRTECGGKRDNKCLYETCHKHINFFYALSKKAIAVGPPGGFATPPSYHSSAKNEAEKEAEASSEAAKDVEAYDALAITAMLAAIK